MEDLTSLSRSNRFAIRARPAVHYDTAKRLLDVVAAANALVFFAPLLLVIAIAVWLDDRGPVLFRQDRIGRGGTHFTMLKFRTMSRSAPNICTEDMKLLGRLYYTRVGVWLRRTSFDELPQLWNILKGDMSIVGPRPALYSQDLLTSLRDAAAVLCVRPGITGLAQINGRDDLDIPTKVSYDWEYVRDRSLRLDLQILMKTFRAVASARGNY